MTKIESCRVTFGQLDFWFEESVLSTGQCQLIGFAPQGRVGIVEFLEIDDASKVSLLVSADSDRNTELWSAICVGTLAVMLNVDFPGWLGTQMRRRGVIRPWSTARRFGAARVSAAFYPLDTMLVTVRTPATRSAPSVGERDPSVGMPE